jgi:predicted protein tyrosine phosphatase
MINEIRTYPQYKIRGLIDGTYNKPIEKKWALISIYHNDKYPTIRNKIEARKLREKNCLKILSLCFGDYTKAQYIYYTDKYKSASRHVNVMTDKDAHKIVTFLKNLKKIPEIELLIIQCKAGISRSGAVGLFAGEVFGIDINKFRLENNIKPNHYIYERLDSFKYLL